MSGCCHGGLSTPSITEVLQICYAIRYTNVQLPDPEQDEPYSSPTSEFDAGEVYDEGYYMAVIAMADEVDQWDCCFNCGKEGHHWAECTELGKDSLKRAKE